MMKRFAILLLTLWALAAGCATTQSADGVFALTSVNGETLSDVKVTVQLESANLSGRGPVNNWRASVNDGGKIGPIIATRMAGPPHAMQAESALLPKIEGSTLAVEGDKLIFTKGDNTVIFTRE